TPGETMLGKITRSVFICLIFIATISYHSTYAGERPLSKSELMALVAGDILPDNVLAEISARGLNFEPDDAYTALLKAAGAPPKVLAAVAAAKSVSARKLEPAKAPELLLRLSRAGNLIRSGKTEDAARELSSLGPGDASKSEVAFVMGLALIRDERYVEA